ncbi:hypothetical protein QJS04_geneDACA005622 [Acorus gramineus]|uniref:RanBP2-type domain-containing protein n=1 Tax=Acorus gramineus TaxID=55184 RepID=A0AAV9A4K9_ACOGR|nr:hypothetical protein QJS04_geneDACA005622 [Acorus gramineus]
MNRKPGDWDCRQCQHMNFSRRDSCQKCGGERGDFAFLGGRAGGGSSFGFSGSDVRPGDWYCGGNCGVLNFASRSSCFKCGASKEDSAVGIGAGGFGGGGGGRAGWKSGDWICPRLDCKEHNFASRMECFRCNAPREYGTTV